MSTHSTRSTTSHETIRKWAESRCGRPATVAATGDYQDPGILRIDFGEPDEGLAGTSWDEFFQKFDDSDLEFVYQEETQDGGTSRFFKFVKKAK